MVYKSNISQVVRRLISKIKKVDSAIQGAISREVATTLQASNLRRIHTDGLAVDGSGILGGSYSTKPTLVGSSSFANKSGANKIFGSKAKRSQQDWRTYRGRKLVLLDGGYKKVRELSGRQTAKVDLNFTGKLSKEFGIDMRESDYVLGFTTQDATQKAEGLEDRNGSDIWGVTTDDEKLINEITQRRISNILR